MQSRTQKLESRSPARLSTVPYLQWGTHLAHFFSSGDELCDLLALFQGRTGKQRTVPVGDGPGLQRLTSSFCASRGGARSGQARAGQSDRSRQRRQIKQWSLTIFILKVDLYDTAMLLEQVGNVIARGGSGVAIKTLLRV